MTLEPVHVLAQVSRLLSPYFIGSEITATSGIWLVFLMSLAEGQPVVGTFQDLIGALLVWPDVELRI
jgi:hypothetical protein